MTRIPTAHRRHLFFGAGALAVGGLITSSLAGRTLVGGARRRRRPRRAGPSGSIRCPMHVQVNAAAVPGAVTVQDHPHLRAGQRLGELGRERGGTLGVRGARATKGDGGVGVASPSHRTTGRRSATACSTCGSRYSTGVYPAGLRATSAPPRSANACRNSLASHTVHT